MNLNEIREAVELLKRNETCFQLISEPNIADKEFIASAFYKVLDLAESVLNAEVPKKDKDEFVDLAEEVLNAEMPEKDKYEFVPITYNQDWQNGKSVGRNEALDQCRLVIARDYVRKDELPTVEEIVNILNRVVDEWDGHGRWNYVLATAIHDRLVKGREK